MKVTIIPIVIGALGIHQRISIETGGLGNNRRPLKLLHYWYRPEYWEESWRLETCCHSNFSERPSVLADVKNSQGVNIISFYWLELCFTFPSKWRSSDWSFLVLDTTQQSTCCLWALWCVWHREILLSVLLNNILLSAPELPFFKVFSCKNL